ncbi:MAG: hypothetical protein KZQ70_04735 [gamma proteobacterium symbiont of Lucinoma myriamae]|nr:hypothetical protein [gamma proteobacterium symbiont of Lucinoma myriamae]MCU7831843.1 hypothetical protein [gamma proteobacterium symbiont of Lucinoma myriamae]
MINKFIIFFICLTTAVFADDFKCQHYEFDEANNWLCAHLERGTFQALAPDVLLSNKIPIDNDTIKKIEIVFSQAELSYEEGNYAKVEQDYRQLIKEQTHYAPAWIKQAQFYSDLNREHDALQTLHQALEVIADNADIYHEMGLVQVRLRSFSKAVTSLAKAAVKAPDNSHYSYVYGIALNSFQRPYKALDVLQQAHYRHPDNMEVLLALFAISQDINEQTKALIFAQKILLIKPDNDSAQRYMLKF